MKVLHKEILNYQRNFYTNLYSIHNVVDDEHLESEIGVNSNKLENEEAGKFEGEILYTALTKALKTTKNNKTPGLDSFTVEFLEIVLIDIEHFVHRSVNYSYRTGSLSVTQKQGILTCLPKPNKSREYLKNWRPISLLNGIYKLASTVILDR